MSDPTTQDDSPANIDADTPSKKKAAKTAKKAAKKSAKKAAKKAVKKVAKKAAKKAVKKIVEKVKPAAEKPLEQKTLDIAPDTKEVKKPEIKETVTHPKATKITPEKVANSDEEKSTTVNQERTNNSDKPGRNHSPQDQSKNGRQDNRQRNQKSQPRNNRNRQGRERKPRRENVLTGEPVDINGMLEIAPKGFGFLRVPEKNYEQCQQDVFVTPDLIRKHGLRAGVWVKGTYKEGPRGPQLTSIEKVNDLSLDESFRLPHFDELKAINPNRRISFETTPDRYTTRILDIVSPVGRGQRGLIVSPPRSGKTTLLLHMAEAIKEKYDESIHLIILLIDERPEEVTEFKRMLPNAEIYASSNDDPAKSHARIAELCIERAKRLVEGGKDVLILMDSITRLARSYNNNGGGGGGKQKKKRGYQSGGIVAGALEVPRRIFAAARNTRNAGSLTIIATALVQTNSRADEAIFQEFKGTGNMELVLDRRIAEQYLFPAVDIFKSATRREELIMAEHLLTKINLIRRGLKGHRPEEAIERLLFFLKRFPNNAQMLLEIKG